MRSFVRLGSCFFCRVGRGIANLDAFDAAIRDWLPVLPGVFLLRLTGELLPEVVKRKGVAAGSLDGWGWREMKALPVPWFDKLADVLAPVVELGVWPEGLLDACIAMIWW